MIVDPVSVSVAFRGRNSIFINNWMVSCEIKIEAANASRLPRLVRSEEPKLAVPLKIRATTAMLLLFEAIFLG